jgi:hypothetical protein
MLSADVDQRLPGRHGHTLFPHEEWRSRLLRRRRSRFSKGTAPAA